MALLIIAAMTAAAFAIVAVAQDIPVRPVDAEKRAAIVDAVAEKLTKYYIDEDVAEQMVGLLRRKLEEGKYDHLVELRPFVRQLTADIREVSNDQHLGVWPIEYAILTDEASEEDRRRFLARARYDNFGFNAVRRLPGNIGYVEMSYFDDIEFGGDTAVAAMRLMANADALIIDVRRNGGGSGVLALMMSYFFEEPVHTADSYSRIEDSTRQFWTFGYVPGPRLTEVPIYVLQSRRTASAAEALGYQLKALKRGTLVGEKTKGAANPIEEFSIPELSICMAVSSYRVSNPVTGTCWEGVGVEPDIAVDGELALYAAGVEAMKKLLEEPCEYSDIEWGRRLALEIYQAQLKQIELTGEQQEQYVGRYGDSYAVRLSYGVLALERPRQLPVTLIPLGGDAFAYQEEEGRVEFKRDASGAISEMETVTVYGSRTYSRKGS